MAIVLLFDLLAMKDDETKEAPSRSHLGRWVMWGLFVLLFCYPLSIGPYIWVAEKTRSTALRSSFHIVYAPLVWVGEIPLARKIFDWYVHDLWGIPGGSAKP
ncbi:MAG: hypothetical protein ACWGQW_23285 [bacterium]